MSESKQNNKTQVALVDNKHKSGAVHQPRQKSPTSADKKGKIHKQPHNNPQKNEKEKRLSPSGEQKKLYFNSDPKQTQRRLEQMKKLRQEYSHQKTSQVVKEVQDKIKGWMEKQKSAERKRLHFIEKSLKEQQEMQKIEKQHKMSSKQRQQQQHHDEVMDRLRKLKQKSNQRFQELKNSNVTFKSTVQSTPLYLQKQKQYQERQKQLDMEIRQQLMNKRSSLNVNVSEIRQHERKYLEEIKQRENERKRNKRNKQNLEKDAKGNNSYEFVTIFNSNDIQRKQDQFKRQRIKEFSENLLNLSPDQQTLERIKQKRQRQKQRSVDLQGSGVTQFKEKNAKKLRPRKAASTKNLSKVQPTQMRKMGNQYLRELKHRTVSERRLPPAKQQQKLPQIAQPRYKNYLAQLNLKHPKALDQIEMTKKMFKEEPGQAILEFNKKSQKYEKNMLKMVKQLKTIQKNEDYEKGLSKQAQIDEMYNKTLKMRLACLEMS